MKARKDIVKAGTKTGATLGGIVFLFFGLIPGFYFGSYGAMTVLKYLMGGPVEPTVGVRIFAAMGIVLGIASLAAVSIVVGSIAGTTIGFLAKAASEKAEVQETSAAEGKAR
ncbi:MAG: hypothetical protein K8I29_10810 [Alphaproteobacteria bacterium]|uniref:Uncharacterized protein n=1 Tax=Candidatus Nitrobium versatile TaxID=2884831 RepID=A0A953JB38_9BACT|nr:hypothetical protein [Candidatus Nitrobium versatile]